MAEVLHGWALENFLNPRPAPGMSSGLGSDELLLCLQKNTVSRVFALARFGPSRSKPHRVATHLESAFGQGFGGEKAGMIWATGAFQQAMCQALILCHFDDNTSFIVNPDA
jgi:hypothetical protein